MDAALLLLELGAVLLVLSVAARVSARLGLSPIPLYLVVGLAVGDGGLYPLITADGFIEAGAEIGVVLLLLSLGLEYSPSELLTGLRTTLPLTILDLVVNALPGAVMALVLGWGPLGAVALAGITYVSSSGIAAKLIDDLGWLANRETPLVLSLLVAEDLVMALYLPLLAVLLTGGSALAAGVSLSVALLVSGALLIASLRYSEQLSSLVFSRSPEGLLLGLLGATMMVAGGAERLHISAAVGAFLLGIALSGPVQEHGRTLLRPLRDLFAATFFVFFGLGIDPAEMLPVAVPALLLAAITAATKFGAVSWGAARAGIASRGRRRAGAVLIARGEFSVVVAELAVAARVHPDLGPLTTAYVLLLAVGGSVATRALSRPTRSHRANAPRPASTPSGGVPDRE